MKTVIFAKCLWMLQKKCLKYHYTITASLPNWHESKHTYTHSESCYLMLLSNWKFKHGTKKTHQIEGVCACVCVCVYAVFGVYFLRFACISFVSIAKRKALLISIWCRNGVWVTNVQLSLARSVAIHCVFHSLLLQNEKWVNIYNECKLLLKSVFVMFNGIIYCSSHFQDTVYRPHKNRNSFNLNKLKPN